MVSEDFAPTDRLLSAGALARVMAGLVWQVFWSGLTNVCGNPSTVFPAGRFCQGRADEAGLPIGLQIVGAEWNDMTTIAFAKALEAEAGYGFSPPDALRHAPAQRRA